MNIVENHGRPAFEVSFNDVLFINTDFHKNNIITERSLRSPYTYVNSKYIFQKCSSIFR